MSDDTSQQHGQPPPLDAGAGLTQHGVDCHSCRSYIDPAFAYCPHCGKRQRVGEAWYYHPISILLLAFVAIGPFALPLVWKSQQMSPTVKAVFTVAILIYTGFSIYAVYKIVSFELQFLRQLDGVLR